MKNIYSLIMGATLLALWIPFNYTIDDFTLYDTFRIEKTKPDQSKKPDKKARVLLSKSPLRVKRQGVAALIAPAIAATKTYSLTNDTGLTGASAGDELEYTIVITNSGDTDATGVSFSDQIDANTTLVTGSLKVSPVAQNDSYQTIGNVGLDIPQASGVLNNDVNPGSGTLVITTASPITTSQGGTVTLNTTTGAFTYEPAPGYTGGNDTFTYTLSNGSDLTSTATVTIAVSGKVWFVNNAATNSGTGTLSSPFRQMSDFSTANTGTSGKPGDNDYVFIYSGSGNYTGAATLRMGQKLIGQGATASLLSITGYTAPSGTNRLPAPGTNPILTTTVANTNALTLGSGNVLRGLTIGNTTGSKIDGTDFGTLTVSEAALTGSGQALNLTNGTLAATFTGITSNNSAAAGISLTNVTGNLTSNDGTTITNSSAQGISVSNTASSGTFNFGTTSITGTGSTGLASSGFANTLQFNSLTITPANGQKGIDISSGTGTLNVTTGSVTANGNSAINIAGTNTSNRINLGTTFTSLSSTNSSTSGISLSNVQGNLTSTTTTITNPTGQGINVSTAASGTFSFGTTSITGSGGTGLASTGFANTLTFNSLTITPDAGQKGIDITGATGTLNITASPEITTSNNTAVSIAGVNSGSKVTLGVALTRVSANGSANGISLTNTSGTFQVTGSGTTDGSGGTIQNTSARGAEFINAAGITLKNMNFISANTTDGCSPASAGISFSGCNGAVYLESVSNVILDNININSTDGSNSTGSNSQRGITGTGITNLSISNTVVKNTGNATEEGPIFLQNLSGTINLTSLNLTGSAGIDDLFRIENTSTTSTITIDGSTFSNTQTSVNGSYGLIVSNFGTGTTTVHVKNSTFNQIRTQGIKGIAEGTGTLNYNITGCTFDPQAGIGSAIDLVSNQSGKLNFNILNNPTAKARGTSVINVVSQGTSAAQGRINNNTITHVGGVGDTGNGVRVLAEESSSLIVQIHDNRISGVPSEAGILARSRNGSGRLDVIITDNIVSLPTATNEIGHNIQVEAGTSGSTFSNPTCAYVADNNTSGGRSQLGSDFRVRSATLNHIIYLQAKGGTNNSAENIWNNNTNIPATPTGTVSQSGTWGSTIQLGTCNTPSNPSVARMMADAPATPDTTQALTESAVAVTNPGADSTVQVAEQEVPVVQSAPVVKASTPGIATTQSAAREATTQAVEDVLVNGSGNGFTLPAGKSVTIKFKVTINSTIPAGTCQVSNQGRVSGSNISNILTDDPGVGGSADPTVTPLISAPVITANQTNIITDPDAGVCTASESFAVTVAGCPAPTITYKIGNDVITSPHIFPSGTTTVNVTVSNGNAPDATSSFTVTVNPQAAPAINQEPVAKSVCAGSNATFSVTASSTGLSYKWQKKTGDGEFIDIPTAGNPSAATATLTLPAVTLSESGTQYRAIVSNQCSGSTTSSAATLTVTPLPTATIDGATTVCQGATSPEITFTGADGTAPYTFTYKVGNGAEQTISTQGTNSSVTIPQVTSTAGTFTYTLISVKDALAGECTQPQTGSATITITPLPTATIDGTIIVCKESPSPDITFTGANGTAPYTFTYTINGEEKTITTTIGNSVKVVQETVEAGSFVYALVSVADAGQCSQPQTGSATVTVTNPTEGGTVSGSAVACKDANSGTLTLSDHTGNIIKWQSSTDNSTWTDIANTTTSQAYTNLSQTTYYRAAIQSGDCGVVYSTVATVTIVPITEATATGTTTVGQGAAQPSVTFSVTGGTAPYTFTYTVDNGSPTTVSTTGVATTATVQQPTSSVGSFTYTLVKVTDATGCDFTPATAQTATITVSSDLTATISGGTTVCKDATAPELTFTASGGTGPFTFYYTINGQAEQSVSTTGDATTALVPQPTAAAGSFVYVLTRVTGAGNASNPVTGQKATITVTPASVGGSIAGSTTVCKDVNGGTLTLSGNTGSIVKWQSSTDNSTWTDIANTTTSQAYTNLSQTTYYRAAIQSGDCGVVYSTVATVTIVPITEATATGTTTVGQGAAQPSVTFSVTGGTAPYTFTYTVDNGTPTTVSTTGVATTASVQQPTSSVGSFTYTLVKVTDATGCDFTPATAQTATITVSSDLTATISGGTTVCKDATAPELTFTASGGTGPFTFYYTVNGQAEQSVSTTGDATTALVPQPTAAAGSFVYVLTRVTGAGNASNPVTGQTATITVSPTSVGGTASATAATVCTGTGTTISLSGHTGTIQWQSSTDNSTWNNIDEQTSASLNTGNLTTTTYFRARVTSGVCSEAFSLVATVTVLAPAVPVATGTTIAFGEAATLTATGCTGDGSVLKWYQASDNALVTMPVSPAVTTQYYARCEQTLGQLVCLSEKSESVTLTVLNPTPPVAQDAAVCAGASVTLSATGCTGDGFTLKWYQASDNALVNMPVSPAATTRYYARCEQLIGNTTATSDKSNEVEVAVLAPQAPVAQGATAYQGQSVTLSATGCTGDGFTLKWYQASDNALVTMPVSPAVTTQYYARCEQTLHGTSCLSGKSNEVTLQVGKRLFVNIANQSVTQNGSSWATAYSNLHTALAAATADVEVWVAKGTYWTTSTKDRTVSFQVPNGVRLYGGFAGSEDALTERDVKTNATILSGEIGDLNSVGDNSYHVVLFSGNDNTTRLDGFTITAGNANMGGIKPVEPSNTDQPIDLNMGGGIAMDGGAKPVIANCTIIANYGAFGGGVSLISSSPTFLNCIIRGNQASFGGGVYNVYSSPQFTNVLFAGNYGPGGALYNSQSTPTLTNVTIAGNGGERAASLNTRESHLTIHNSIIWGNQGQTLDQNATISNSIVEGGYTGAGNLNVNPRFVQPVAYDQAPTLAGDYRLQSSSAAIDAGDNTVTSGDLDLDGNARRYNGGVVDMGAYEYQGSRTGSGMVISIKTGNWEDPSTWDVGRVPAAGDQVVLDQNHTVSVNGIATAQTIEYRQNATLQFNGTNSSIQLGL